MNPCYMELCTCLYVFVSAWFYVCTYVCVLHVMLGLRTISGGRYRVCMNMQFIDTILSNDADTVKERTEV